MFPFIINLALHLALSLLLQCELWEEALDLVRKRGNEVHFVHESEREREREREKERERERDSCSLALASGDSLIYNII